MTAEEMRREILRRRLTRLSLSGLRALRRGELERILREADKGAK